MSTQKHTAEVYVGLSRFTVYSVGNSALVQDVVRICTALGDDVERHSELWYRVVAVFERSLVR